MVQWNDNLLNSFLNSKRENLLILFEMLEDETINQLNDNNYNLMLIHSINMVVISNKSNGNQNNQSLRYDELGVDPISRGNGDWY